MKCASVLPKKEEDVHKLAITMSSDQPKDQPSSQHAQFVKSLNEVRQDESAEEGLRQGKRRRVAASKESYEHFSTKNWAETERTLDPSNRSSHASEGKKVS
jgi:hypothetical protein